MPLLSWTRLEPRPRDASLTDGLQARVADPLWLLARQVVFGEFQGEDNGSPVGVRVRARTDRLSRFRGGGSSATGTGSLLTSATSALEAVVEAESVSGDARSGPGALAAAEAGQYYLRLLAREGAGDLTTYRANLISTYQMAPAAAAEARLRPFVGRVPDGVALYTAFRAVLDAGGSLPPANPALGNANRAVVSIVATLWLTWYEALYVQGISSTPAWTPSRMEYSAAVASPGPDGEKVFSITEYASGSLDWHDFDRAPSTPSLGAVAADLREGEKSIVFTTLPTPVVFHGMPLPRFWSFENAAVDLGAVSAPVESLTTNLIVEFALRYGNDHWLFPLPLEVGAVCRIDSLVVLNTFGEVFLIRPTVQVDGPTSPFRLFEHSLLSSSPSPSREVLFVLFPTLDHVVDGPPVEEVHYLRDEMADLVWAIERSALGPAGVPVDRTQAELSSSTASPDVGPSDPRTLSYVLRTEVPGNWFPFLPPELGPATSIVPAVLAALDGTPAAAAWGRVIAEQRGGIPSEEVTREGVWVKRMWRYARWIDGRQLGWLGRRAGPGRGEGASGLQFDVLEPFQPPTPVTGSPIQVGRRATVGQTTVVRILS